MGRRGGWGVVVVVGVVLAACSSGGDSSTVDTTGDGSADATGETTGETTGEATSEPTGQPDGSNDGDPTPDGPALPGLIDTSDDPIPNDAAVRTGTLANGLTYYVRENDNPGAKADMRLAIEAGSVDELGPETGVAHFVEHMLFNGTEAFPEN
jgi:zinc protease